MSRFKALVERLMATEVKLVVSVTGCGGSFLASMVQYPGSSKFFIEGSNLYSRQAMKIHLNKKDIDKFCSAETTTMLAETALMRGQRCLFNSISNDFARLKEVNLRNVVGVAMNGSVSSNYIKKGPIQCFVQIRKYNYTRKYRFTTEACGREAEEEMFSLATLALLVNDAEGLSDQDVIKGFPDLNVIAHTKDIPFISNESILLPSMFVNPPLINASIFSGSFNPFHTGHYEMYQHSKSHGLLEGTPLILELTVKNADKKQNTNIHERVRSIVNHFNNQRSSQVFGEQELWTYSISQMEKLNLQVLVSNKGKFVEKQLRNGCFIIGGDTYVRLWDLKYYNNDPNELKKVVARFLIDNVKFLVFNRKNPDTDDFELIVDHGIDYEVLEGWSNDVSSTFIRQGIN